MIDATKFVVRLAFALIGFVFTFPIFFIWNVFYAPIAALVWLKLWAFNERYPLEWHEDEWWWHISLIWWPWEY